MGVACFRNVSERNFLTLSISVMIPLWRVAGGGCVMALLATIGHSHSLSLSLSCATTHYSLLTTQCPSGNCTLSSSLKHCPTKVLALNIRQSYIIGPTIDTTAGPTSQSHWLSLASNKSGEGWKGSALGNRWIIGGGAQDNEEQWVGECNNYTAVQCVPVYHLILISSILLHHLSYSYTIQIGSVYLHIVYMQIWA